MSKSDPELTERSSAAGATDFERRLLEAAGREQPSRELSERMARAIGISLPPLGGGAVGKNTVPTAAVPKAATASGSLLSWAAGTIVTGAIVLGAFVALRPSSAPLVVAPSASASSAVDVTEKPVSAEPKATATSPSPVAETGVTPRPVVAAAQGRERAAATDLSDQLALMDAAHRALSGGDGAGALALARKYSAEYPSGTFRPEAAAIRIEALVKLGRVAEARSLGSKFASTYGPGPLADRMATVVGALPP